MLGDKDDDDDDRSAERYLIQGSQRAIFLFVNIITTIIFTIICNESEWIFIFIRNF